MNRTIKSPDSDTITNGVRIHAAARYAPEQSDPDNCSYVYSYRITMTNEGDATVRLLRRHWIILDAFGEREEVEGDGVVGEHPVLEPGETYSYVSRCPLSTSWGTMEGSYAFFRGDDSEPIEVEIGRFFLVPSSA
ncbi:MAG: Co2+/Mg2+ efflux protein ApaG [Planctomycetes bacterium]|nr:Co2+/Mg2+ efflux protein ApaG [Planctomycetota bacterium]